MSSSSYLPWIDDAPGAPLAKRIVASLGARIADGRIPPGELLTEVAVAEEYGASRTPVREAMLQLQAWGFVTLLAKKGALVTIPTTTERGELVEVRGLFEKAAVRRVSSDDDKRNELLKELRDLLDQQQRDLDDATAFAVDDYLFHLAIMRSAGNSVVGNIAATLGPRWFRLTHLAGRSGREARQIFLTDHTELAAAIDRGNAVAFDGLIDAHLASGHSGYEVDA